MILTHPPLLSFSDINGILLFYRKTTLGGGGGESLKGVDSLTLGFGNLNTPSAVSPIYPGLNGSGKKTQPLVQEPAYENVKTASPGLPVRPAPRPPAPLPPRQSNNNLQPQPKSSNFQTLGRIYSELDGVPFQLSSMMRKSDSYTLPPNLFTVDSSGFGYDFELERQVLCTTKAITSSNPFFR